MVENFTKRVISHEMEREIGLEHKVLDHGFIMLVDYMGNDSSIVQAARVSYASGTKTVREDKGLIDYLMKNKHLTPVEMCEIKFMIKLPIFICRQLIRTRTANINEVSARYSIIEDEFYVPENVCKQSINNKQARGEQVNEYDNKMVKSLVLTNSLNAHIDYKIMINKGIAREIARTVLPVNYYTTIYWKIDLRNLLHFLHLRMDKHAQYEMQIYANEIAKIVKKWVPYTWEAFMKYEVDSITLSKEAIQVMKKLIKGEQVEDGDLSKSDLKQIEELIK
jgi:thymidylate synthase (FAD)